MSRLDKDREQRLQPERMATAKKKLTEIGYQITYEDQTRIEFIHEGQVVKYFPYSGWASGKSINDGRGLQNLLKQLK